MIPLIFTLDIFMVSWTFIRLSFDFFFLQKAAYIINIDRYLRKGCINHEREESDRERMSCHLIVQSVKNSRRLSDP